MSYMYSMNSDLKREFILYFLFQLINSLRRARVKHSKPKLVSFASPIDLVLTFTTLWANSLSAGYREQPLPWLLIISGYLNALPYLPYLPFTVNPHYTDTRYNENIRYTDSLTGTETLSQGQLISNYVGTLLFNTSSNICFGYPKHIRFMNK